MVLNRLFSSAIKYFVASGLCVAALQTSASANNVQVRLEGSLVTIFGDNAANDLTVTQNSAGDISVVGRNGTRINNLPSVVLRRVALNAMEIRLEGGNDIVTIRGLRPANDLYVNLGAGNDRFTANSPVTVGGNVAIEGDAGNDTVNVTGMAVEGDLYVDGGIGTLRSSLTNLDIGFNVTVIGDDAADVVTLSNVLAGDYISLETKKGNDRVSVSGIFALGFMANTDAGADSITFLDSTTMEDVGIFTGSENDRVVMSNIAAGKNLLVSVDAGSDFVSGTAVTAVEDLVAEGGAGTDTLEDFGLVGGTKTEFKEFEIILP
jgi:hypothetical protein